MLEQEEKYREMQACLVELTVAAKEVGDTVIAAANQEKGREQNWSKKFDRLYHAISASETITNQRKKQIELELEVQKIQTIGEAS